MGLDATQFWPCRKPEANNLCLKDHPISYKNAQRISANPIGCSAGPCHGLAPSNPWTVRTAILQQQPRLLADQQVLLGYNNIFDMSGRQSAVGRPMRAYRQLFLPRGESAGPGRELRGAHLPPVLRELGLLEQGGRRVYLWPVHHQR